MKHSVTGFVLFALLASALGAAEPEPAPATMLDDARLHSIEFIDPDRGWAVGDRGVIWRTIDGGRSWRLQPAGVYGTLEAVQFVDSRHGWIVGGWTEPYTHESRAIILRTLDGGETWQRIPCPILPAIKQIRFFSPREGMAVGDASDLFPSGAFRTTDGGKSWTPLASNDAQQLTAGDFVDLETGAVAGPGGRLGAIAYSRTAPSRTPDLGPRTLRDLELRGLSGWLVGDGGLVMRTEDGGTSWRFPDAPLPEGAQEYFDFRAVATFGQHSWFAGAPGSSVLHTPDGGRTWERFATGSPVPLDELTFLDEKRGWAVGALGTILATRDGGRSWRSVRGPLRRLAMLGFFAGPESTPWELWAQYCASEGYLGAVEQMVSSETPGVAATTSSAEDRLAAAVLAAGGSAAHLAWNFPGGPPGLELTVPRITGRWDQWNDGQGTEHLRELLVRKIRQWRPDVVITENTDARAGNAAQNQLAQLVVAAAQQAGDPTVYPDHAALAGLAPWRVSKVFAQTTSTTAAVRLNTFQLATNLQSALRDYAAPARGHVYREFTNPPAHIGLRLLVNRLPQDVGQAGVFSGLNLPPSSTARRPPLEVPIEDLEALSRLTQQRQNVEQLIARASEGGEAWMAQVEDLTRGFAPATSGLVLAQLAQQYEAQGRMDLAADIRQRLLHSYPDHPLSDAALVWLVQYYASSEVAWRYAKTTRFQSQVITAQFDPDQVEPVRAERTPEAPMLAAASLPLPSTRVPTTAAAVWDRKSRSPQALEFGTLIARSRPTLYADPAVRFPLGVCQREMGFGRDSEQYLQQLTTRGSSPAWRLAAMGELWLRHANGAAPKPVANCARALEPPHLDGNLHDALWQHVRAIPLTTEAGDDGGWPTEVKLAYDDEFLYFAAHCRRAPEGAYPTSTEARPRDPDLRERDRIEILLDMDRDYASYYRLVVDHRGWPRDECWGDKSWDPDWFVAQSEDEASWTIELALPWSAVGPAPPTTRAAWAIGLQRVAPQTGLQAWTWPAAVAPVPEAFGILVFE